VDIDRKEYMRQYRLEHHERIAAQIKEWHLRNSDYDKNRNRKWYLENKELVAARVKEWKTQNKGSYYESNRKWTNNNPEKRRAHWIKENAVRSGFLVKQPCSVCGTTNFIDAHHPDYTEPLKVIWLCRLHHGELHAMEIK
jgi:hypothetical protein